MGRLRWSRILAIGSLVYMVMRMMNRRSRATGMNRLSRWGANMMSQMRSGSSRMMRSMRRMAR